MAGPWARYIAKLVDLGSLTLVLGYLISHSAAVAVPLVAFAGLDYYEALIFFVVLPVSLLVDAFIYALFGNTIGRAAVGIYVSNKEGASTLSGGAYLHRNARIYVFGYVFGLIPLAWISWLLSFRAVVNGKDTFWDSRSGTTVLDDSSRPWRTFLVFVVWCAISVFVRLPTEFETQTDVERMVSKTALELNMNTPIKISDEVTLIGVMARGHTLVYSYEYTFAVTQSDEDLIPFLEDQRSAVTSATCSNTDIRVMFDSGVAMEYLYFDADRGLLNTILVTKTACME